MNRVEQLERAMAAAMQHLDGPVNAYRSQKAFQALEAALAAPDKLLDRRPAPGSDPVHTDPEIRASVGPGGTCYEVRSLASIIGKPENPAVEQAALEFIHQCGRIERQAKLSPAERRRLEWDAAVAILEAYALTLAHAGAIRR